jgi:hypothetical protein
MTHAQINYRQLLETNRHNRQQEQNWINSLAETIRHDAAQERLSKYQTDTSASTSRYATDTNAATSRYSADTSAEASKYSADTHLTGTKYSSDVSASASRYKTDVEHQDRQARLEFDKYTQNFQNTLAAFSYKLDKMKTESTINLQGAQIVKMQKDVENALTQLEQNARKLDLQELRIEAQNALDRARKWEAYSRTGMNAQQIVRTMAIDAANIVRAIKSKLQAAKDKLKEDELLRDYKTRDEDDDWDPAAELNREFKRGERKANNG